LYLQGEMGRYKRKTERRNFFTNEILRQIKDKINSGQSKRSVAREFNIHEATLRKRLKEDSIPTSLGRFKPVFSQELEERLVEHVKKLDSLFYGVTLRDLRRAAFDYAEGNKLTHRFDKTAKLAGKDRLRTLGHLDACSWTIHRPRVRICSAHTFFIFLINL
jgi:transposase-like protein